MSKKHKKTHPDMILPGWESQDIVKCFPSDEKASEKACKKVNFSHVKRVNKEDMRMEFDKEKALLEIEEMYRARRRGRHVWGKKKCTIIPKRVKKGDKCE